MTCACGMGEMRRRARARRHIGDFRSLMTIPDFASAWNEVGAQLQQEGASSLEVAAAQNDLASAFENLTSSAAGFGLSAGDALNAAKQYTIAGRTVAGAVSHVQGLLQAAQGGDPSQAFQLFTGTLIGAATAAGALSAGVGAVIVAGVGIALDLLKNAGLFGSAPVGVQYCPGCYLNPAPSIQVGCVATGASPIASGSPNWRHYPKRSGGNTNDAQWYATSGVSILPWAGSPGGTQDNWFSCGPYRFIDSAFPLAHYLACETVPSGLGDFSNAFISAWIANKEYELNGLKSQPDWQVLLHLVRVWNRAHSSSSSVLLTPIGRPQVINPTVQEIRQGRTFTGGPLCPPGLPFYPSTLVTDVRNNVSASEPSLAGGGIRVHTGPLATTKRVIRLHAIPMPTSSAWSAHPSSTTSGTTAAILATLGVVGAGALYLRRRRRGRR